MPRRSCSGAGKEEGKNGERQCCRKRHGAGLDGANCAVEVVPPEQSAPKGREAVAQGQLRRRVKTASDNAAESGTALVSMEPIALTKSSPDAAGAGRTASRGAAT